MTPKRSTSGESPADRRRRLERAAGETGATTARAGRTGIQPGPRGGALAPLAPGDLFVRAETSGFAVEWAVLERREGRPEMLHVVPADTNPLAGSADVAADATTGLGPLTLRCAHGAWVGAKVGDEARRSGALDPGMLERARAKAQALAVGAGEGEADGQAADFDPDYEEWVAENLVPARAALLRMGGGDQARDESAGRARTPAAAAPFRAWRLAAAVLLATAAGLGAGLLWQRQARDRMAHGAAGDESVPRLNVPVVWLAPRESLRGAESEARHLPAAASRIVFDLALDRQAPRCREYRLEIRRRDPGHPGRTVWSTPGLLANERSEVTFELPRSLLPDGGYDLLLTGLGGPPACPGVSYSLVVGR
jgi:hypothetical protein